MRGSKARTAAAWAVAIAGLAAGPALADGTAPIVARAEQCLRKNVDRVVAVEPDVQSAASFLVTFTCAAEVAGATRYERNVALVDVFGSFGKAITAPPAGGKPPPAPFEAPKVDPQTGDIVMPAPSTPGGPVNPAVAMLTVVPKLTTEMASQFAPQTVPMSLRRLAGDLVLAARERQVGKGH